MQTTGRSSTPGRHSGPAPRTLVWRIDRYFDVATIVLAIGGGMTYIAFVAR